MSDHLHNLLADDVVLDSLPEDVEASIQVRDDWFAQAGRSEGGFEFLLSDLTRWAPGQTLRVAFLGGDEQLHRDIAEATKAIAGACNIKLDFGGQAGTFDSWSEQDTVMAAEIRVSFDQKGYFSLVGTDSVNALIGSPTGRVGGRPYQRSLNLGGFTIQKPAGWEGTVRHELLHALSFHHSHQNMRGPCESDFRWEDDPGYLPTQDAQGRFIADSGGRRPGVYTYLAGFPNFWPKPKVDHNLRLENPQHTVAGPFDRASVMLYRFPQLFYTTPNSQCAPAGNGVELSVGDKRGLTLLYPHTEPQRRELAEKRGALLSRLEADAEADAGAAGGLEGLEKPVQAHASHSREAIAILKHLPTT